MCVFGSRPMKIATFLRKNDYLPKRVVDSCRERDTFQNKIMEIVEDFACKSNFFHFSFLSSFFSIFCFFCFFFSFFLFFFQFFIFLHFLSFSFIFFHFLSFSFMKAKAAQEQETGRAHEGQGRGTTKGAAEAKPAESKTKAVTRKGCGEHRGNTPIIQ